MEGNSHMEFNHVDEPWEHYAKWNKPDTERQLQADLSCMWNLKKVQLIKAEYKVGCQGLGSGENGGDVA